MFIVISMPRDEFLEMLVFLVIDIVGKCLFILSFWRIGIQWRCAFDWVGLEKFVKRLQLVKQFIERYD